MDRSEERFRELFEHASDGIFIADSNGRYTEVNTAGCALLGYSHDEIVGRSIGELLPEEEVPRLAASRDRMLAGHVDVGEWRLRRKDGALVPVEVSAKILADGRWLGFVRDITQRKETERRVERLIHLHAIVADLGQRALSSADILDEAVLLVARALEVDLTNVLELLPDGQTFLLRAGFGWKPGLVGHVTVPAAGTQPGLVVRFAQPVVVDDASVERRFTPLPPLLDETITSTVSVVIPTRQGPWGALAAHTREHRTFSRDEVDFLRAVANVLGAAIERRRDEDALRESEDTLNRAQAVAHVGSWHLDVQHKRLTWSDETYRIFGIPKGTPIAYETFLAQVPEDERDRVDDAWTVAMHGAPYDIEHRCIVDGGLKWVRERGQVTLDAENRPVEGIGTVQDVTERHLVEEERHRWAETLDAIISTSDDAMISIDRDQRIRLFNPAAERIFGWSRKEILGRPIDELIPERYRAAHRHQVEAFAGHRSGTRRMGNHVPLVGLRKSGEEFPIEAGISKVEIAGAVLLNVSLRDVTDREYTEQEQRFVANVGEILIGAARDYEGTLNGIAEAAVRWFAEFCVVDEVEGDGNVRRLKVAYADPEKAALAERLGRISLDRDRPSLVAAVLSGGRPKLLSEVPDGVLESVAQSEEHLAVLKALRVQSAIVVPLQGPHRTVGTLAFLSSRPFRHYGPRDVRLAERVATLASLAMENARLYDATQRAIRARDDVLGIVAHDLRTPLNSIVLQASLLDATRGGDRIRRSAMRMNRLVQDMLDVAQLESGPLSVRLEPTPPAQLIADAVDAQLPTAIQAGITLRAEPPNGVPDVRADRDRVLQILDNLIGNALKFTSGGGVVTIGAVPDPDGVRFSVVDTGRGMSDQELQHAFDRFWQAERHDRRGVGLGLAIVKGLVEAHRGRLGIESAPARGTTIWFTLPRA